MTELNALFQNLRVWTRRMKVEAPVRTPELEARLVTKLQALGLQPESRQSAIMLVAGKILVDQAGYSVADANRCAVILSKIVYDECHGPNAGTIDVVETARRRLKDQCRQYSVNHEEQVALIAVSMVNARAMEYARPKSLSDVIRQHIATS